MTWIDWPTWFAIRRSPIFRARPIQHIEVCAHCGRHYELLCTLCEMDRTAAHCSPHADVLPMRNRRAGR